MQTVDGSSGGGQLVRTALALSALTDTPIRIEDIRGNRPEPGLKRQHLTGVELIAELCHATVDGAQLGAETVTFEPDATRGGTCDVDVGTAGSLTLLFDTILPLATALDRQLSVTATGGTAVKWSPTLDWYRRVKLPLCRQFGLAAAVERERAGFYPAGGGRATLHLWPSELSSVEYTERGSLTGVRVLSCASESLAENDVGDRQRAEAVSRLDREDIEISESRTAISAAPCPGSSLVVVLEFERAVAGFDSLGEPGKPAETVAGDAAEAALAFLETPAAVDRHAGDQLLLFLALAGGNLRVPALTDHVKTSLELLDAFGYEIDVEKRTDGAVLRST